MPPSKQPP
jgi:hypothetical protein